MPLEPEFGQRQSHTNSKSPNDFSLQRCKSVAGIGLASWLSTPSFIFQRFLRSSLAFQPVRSRPVNRHCQPLSTAQISLGFGFVLGSSLILRFLNRHSEPSDSRAR